MTSASEHGGEVDPKLEIYLDLWVCCQCQVQIVCSGEGDSGVIPSIVDRRGFLDWVKGRMDNPPLDKNPVESVMLAFETILRYIWVSFLWEIRTTETLGIYRILENFLFRQNIGAPKVGNTFQSRVGWSDTVYVPTSPSSSSI